MFACGPCAYLPLKQAKRFPVSALSLVGAGLPTDRRSQRCLRIDRCGHPNKGHTYKAWSVDRLARKSAPRQHNIGRSPFSPDGSPRCRLEGGARTKPTTTIEKEDDAPRARSPPPCPPSGVRWACGRVTPVLRPHAAWTYTRAKHRFRRRYISHPSEFPSDFSPSPHTTGSGRQARKQRQRRVVYYTTVEPRPANQPS